MVLIVPEHHGGLLALQDNSEACIDKSVCEDESIISIAIKALDEKRNITKDYNITMPEFTVDTDVAVKKYLQYVRLS